MATFAGISILAAWGLAGCAAVLPRALPPAAAVETRTYIVPVAVVADLCGEGYVIRNGRAVHVKIPSWGVTTTTTNEPVDLDLDASMKQWPALLLMVTAHELGHVLGYIDHNPDCPWMCASIPETTALVADPCDDTVNRVRARAAGRVVTLVVKEGEDPAFVAALVWAANRWNRILDRAAVIVRTAPTPAREPVPTRPPGGT